MAKNINIVCEPTVGELFPEKIEDISDLHRLQGSLWEGGGFICMFCQVDQVKFSMIVLSQGNRNVRPFNFSEYKEVYHELKDYRRWRGKIILETIQIEWRDGGIGRPAGAKPEWRDLKVRKPKIGCTFFLGQLF